MKKICFVSIFAYPLFNKDSKISHGGAEVQVYNYSKELSKFYDVSVIVGDFGQKKIEEYNNVKVIKSFKLEKKIINYLFAPFKLFFSLVKCNPDVVINRAGGVEVFFSAIYSFFFRKKMIYMVAHDNDVNGVFFKGFFGKLLKLGLKQVDFFIAQNDDQFSNIKNKDKEIMNNSYYLDFKGSKGDYILWVSRCEDWKNPEIFIDLSKRFLSEKFIMIMPKADDLNYYSKVLKKVKKIKNIEFIEKVSFEKIQEYFNKSKIFVNTSDSEGFPNTFIQSGMGGSPIISYKVNPNNIFDNYEIGFCCNGNFELMVEKLDLLLKDKDLYKKYSKNIIDYVKEKHDIKKNVLIFKDIIDRL
ncbi:MAG: glycosyltransferase [Candidatus Nanoarchaeia archaeon]|nr:glycosyltransferase [Candidatus Nanoarchaeia archaeon]